MKIYKSCDLTSCKYNMIDYSQKKNIKKMDEFGYKIYVYYLYSFLKTCAHTHARIHTRAYTHAHTHTRIHTHAQTFSTADCWLFMFNVSYTKNAQFTH